MNDIIFTNNKLKELNTETKAKAIIKYLKDAARNHSPVFAFGIKKENYWLVDFYECMIPASKLPCIKLDAENDKNVDNTEIYFQLTDNIISSFISEDTTTFTIKETEIDVAKNGVKVKLAKSWETSGVEENINNYSSIIDSEENTDECFVIRRDSEIIGLLKEVGANPNAVTFIENTGITFLNETVLLQNKNISKLFARASFNQTFYLNMFLANKILSLLDYCYIVTVSKNDKNICIRGLDEDNEMIVCIISLIYETPTANPSDEDIDNLLPKSNVTEIITTANILLNTLEKQKDFLGAFLKVKNVIAKFHKDENSFSLLIENDDDAHIQIFIKEDFE